MKYFIFLLICFCSLNISGQISLEPNLKEPKFNGFFVGGMLYTDIYPAPKYIFQVNLGVTFSTKSILFDIVPVQVSYVQNNNFKFGSSILLRKYLFKK